MRRKALLSHEYRLFITDLKSRIASAQLSAARAVSRELLLLYWDIGRGIVDRQKELGWGDAVVERLASDLRKAFPDIHGFSSSNVWRMRQIYFEYTSQDFLAQAVPELEKLQNAILAQAVPELEKPTGKLIVSQKVPSKNVQVLSRIDPEFLAQAVRELIAAVPWGHHIELLKKVKSPAARLYYLRATAQLGWSRAVLLNQIKARAYERARAEKKTHNFALALPEYFAEQAEEALKSRYNLEFLGIARPMKERELEDRLIERLQQFILELGYGFCFVGRQYRLALRKKEYFVDLLFYHRFLKSLVAFDLKVGAFEPEHAGKMDFYLNLLNEQERAPDDHPSIGIILCAEKDDVEVEFALKTKGNPIGVAEYKLQSKLPAKFRGKLPTAQQLVEAMRDVMPPDKR